MTIEADGGADLSTARSLWVAVDGVEADSLRGTVEVSSVDRDGFREGDRIETTADRVWDLFQVGEDGRPELNQDRARAMVGKTVLVGITTEGRSRRKPPEQSQIVGTIENIDSTGIRLRLRDGSVYSLPPDIRPFENALPGEYRLGSTGEVITDPDFTCNWVSSPRLQAL